MSSPEKKKKNLKEKILHETKGPEPQSRRTGYGDFSTFIDMDVHKEAIAVTTAGKLGTPRFLL